jgi:outer membrane protein OmpA-like peptidoglycan-associated protein
LSYDITQAKDGHFILGLIDASLNVKDLALRPRDANADWLKMASIEARGLKARWPDRVASLDLLRITDPWVTATRKADSTLSWMPYLKAMQPADTHQAKGGAPAAGDTAPPWTGSVSIIELVNGAVHLEDETVKPKVALDLSRIGVRLDTIRTDPKTRIRVSASLGLGKKATFSTKGTVVRQPFAADLDLSLADLDLTLGQPYLGPNPPIVIAGGLASTKGKVRLRNAKPKMLFEGIAGISALVINDSAKAPLLSWKDTKVRGIRMTSSPDLLRIKTIEVDQPFARIAISRDRQLNLSALGSTVRGSAPQGSQARDTAPQQKFPYEISEVLFKDAEIDFSDESVIIPFRTRIHSTQGAIRDVASFGGTPGTLELEGQIDEYGLARANGTVHVSDPYSATSIKAEFRNVEMPRLTPYTAEFLGYAIKEGRLDMDMDYRIQNRELHAEHHVVAKNMQLGDKMEGGEGPPGFAVKLAVSLLKDRQGNIKLDPLVEGTVDSPEFSYKKVIWQAIKQMLGKIASAPFHFLGKLLGGGDAPELVEFDAGRADVIPPERQKLDSLASTLGEKPEITLSIEGRYDTVADAAALREAKLKLQIESQRDSTAAKTQKTDTGTVMAVILENLYLKTFSRAALDSLRTAFTASPTGAPAPAKEPEADNKKKQAPPPPPPANGFNAAGYYDSLRAQLLTAQTVEPTELVQLGHDRAAAIEAALTATRVLDSTRIKVTDPAPAKKKKSGSSRVASEMSMDAK